MNITDYQSSSDYAKRYFYIKTKNLIDMELCTMNGKFQWRNYDKDKWNNVNLENIPLIEYEV